MSDSVQRIFIGGLPLTCTEEALRERFSPYGRICSIEMIPDILLNLPCRGFAFISFIPHSPSSLSTCQSVYNGAKWSSTKPMSVELAKPNFAARNDERRKREIQKETKRATRDFRLYRHSKNMSLITDDNVDERSGWKRGRHGRAIALMTLRMPSGKLITVDPGHYKSNLEKLYGTEPPKSISNLHWFDDSRSAINDLDEKIAYGEKASATSLESPGINPEMAHSEKPVEKETQKTTQNIKSIVKKKAKVEPVFINLMLNED